MGWFPTSREDPDGWKFDIVSLVAVIGESTIEQHIQQINASALCWLPRLIPAPQALLKTERPTRLPPAKDTTITGVHSGTQLEELNYFANVIHDIRSLRRYEFRRYTIKYRHADVESAAPAASSPTSSSGHSSSGAFFKNRPAGSTNTNTNTNTSTSTSREVHLKTPLNVPLTCASAISVLMTLGLFIWAACIHDAVAMVAIATMSVSTSLACWSGRWHPVLTTRGENSRVPAGDLVLRTRDGAFVVVHCDEKITRELYTCTDCCRYNVTGRLLHGCLGLSTVLLMAAIIFFSNCGWTMQTAIGIAYIIINIIYWAIPIVQENRPAWDLSRYDILHEPESDSWFDENANYTLVLWTAIRETGTTEWVLRGRAAPHTDAWVKWLQLAEANIANPDWDAVAEKNRLMNAAMLESRNTLI